MALVARWLGRHDQELQVRLARELVSSCRRLNREIAELDQELEQRTAALAPALLDLPGCGAITAAKLLAEIGPVGRFTSDAQLARHSGVAPLEASSGRIQRHRLDREPGLDIGATLEHSSAFPPERENRTLQRRLRGPRLQLALQSQVALVEHARFTAASLTPSRHRGRVVTWPST